MIDKQTEEALRGAEIKTFKEWKKDAIISAMLKGDLEKALTETMALKTEEIAEKRKGGRCNAADLIVAESLDVLILDDWMKVVEKEKAESEAKKREAENKKRDEDLTERLTEDMKRTARKNGVSEEKIEKVFGEEPIKEEAIR